MIKFPKVILIILYIGYSLLIAACGGGDGNDNNQDASQPIVSGSLSISTSVLSFEALHNGDNPADQFIEVSFSGNDVAYVGAAYLPNEQRPSWLKAFASSASSPYSFGFGVFDTSIDTGTYTSRFYIGTVRADGTVIDSIPVDITYVVKSVITSLPKTVNFELGTTPLTQQVVLATEGNSIDWSMAVEYLSGTDWLTVSVDGNGRLPATLALDAKILDMGTYAANIIITSLNNTDTLTIPVNYTVPEPRSTPASAAFLVDTSTISDQLIQTVTLLDRYFSANTAEDVTWSVSSDTAWVSIAPTSGRASVDRSFSIKIDETVLNSVAPGQQEAVITVSAAGVADLLIPVKLTLMLSYVSPYVAVPNTSAEVIVRGAGFDYIGTQAISFGTSLATDAMLLSDSEFRINNPALASGRYLITIANALGLDRSQAELVVVDSPNYTSTKIAVRGGYVGSRTIYDAERQTLFIGDPNEAHIERYQLAPGSGWSTDFLLIEGLRDIAQSPNGKLLLVATYTGLVYVDAGTFAITDQITLPVNIQGGKAHSLAFTNNGKVVTLLGDSIKPYVFDLESQSFELLLNKTFTNPTVTASANLSRLIVTESSISSALVYYYDASNGQFVETTTSMVTKSVSFDRAGKNVILDSRYVFDENFNQLGQLPIYTVTVMSPSGTLAYGYNNNILYTYNILQPDNPGGAITAVGAGTAISNHSGGVGRLLLSHDAGNIFVIGNTLSVVPTP